MACLARASWPALRKLNLGLTSMARHDVMANGLLRMFSKLEALDLSNHYLSHKALQQLGQLPWPHLKSMGLANCLGGIEDVEFMSTVTRPMFELLDLSRNKLSNALIAVLSWPQFRQLKELFLDPTWDTIKLTIQLIPCLLNLILLIALLRYLSALSLNLWT